MKNYKNVDVSRKEKDMAALSKPYLVLYNTAQTAGWSLILFETVKHLIKHKSADGLWKVCSTNVMIFQTLAALEVLHCLFRIVPANPLITFVQVMSRVVQVWGIMLPVEKVHNHPALALTFVAWSITEVVRYSYYCAQLLGKPSFFHTWCRYSLFYVLYPSGVTGELGNMYVSLNTIKARQLYSILLPNSMNISFSYYYSTIMLMIAYIPLFPHLFNHMRKQRKKVLGELSKQKKI